MTFDWKKIATAFLTVLAQQGGTWAVIAALLRDYLLPLLISDPELTLADATPTGAAPEEFKTAVREKLLNLVDRIKRPLIKVVLKRAISMLSDTVLDTVYDMVVGKPTPVFASGDELTMAAMEDLAA